jgi:hypothetical protein
MACLVCDGASSIACDPAPVATRAGLRRAAYLLAQNGEGFCGGCWFSYARFRYRRLKPIWGDAVPEEVILAGWLTAEKRGKKRKAGTKFSYRKPMPVWNSLIDDPEIEDWLDQVSRKIETIPDADIIAYCGGNADLREGVERFVAKTQKAITTTAVFHRGRKRSPEICAKIGADKRQWWGLATPEERAHHAEVRRGKKPTAETRAKLSAALKKRWDQAPTEARQKARANFIAIGHKNRGKRATAETRAKLSAAQKKRWEQGPPSAETRAKISASNKGKHIHSEEARAKIGAAHKGKKVSPETRAKISAAQKLYWRKLAAKT